MVWSDDPAADYDRYCEMQEQAYQDMIHGMTCRDCSGHIEINPDDDSAWGWCKEQGDYVRLDDLVSEIDCESYDGPANPDPDWREQERGDYLYDLMRDREIEDR